MSHSIISMFWTKGFIAQPPAVFSSFATLFLVVDKEAPTNFVGAGYYFLVHHKTLSEVVVYGRIWRNSSNNVASVIHDFQVHSFRKNDRRTCRCFLNIVFKIESSDFICCENTIIIQHVFRNVRTTWRLFPLWIIPEFLV